MSLESDDLSIIEILQRDSRTPLSRIGEMVGLSRFAVKDRIYKLFADRVIFGPTIIVNPALAGLKRTVFFELKTNPHEPWLAELLEEMTACDLLDGITGEYSLLARFRISDEGHFDKTLKRIDEAMSRSFFKKYQVIDAINTFKESGVPFNKKAITPDLDRIDFEILKILLNQTTYVRAPRPLSTTQISEIISDRGIQISQPAVFRRLRRLESRSVILRHTIMVDQLKLGLRTKLVVRIKVNPASHTTVAHNLLTPMDQILDLYRTGEDYGLLATIRISNIAEYNSFLLRLYASEDIIDTHTVLVLEERKQSPLPLSEYC